ncbi:pre-mRNA processing RNA-helicase [Ascosphaera acerosa]|nr:pre-mRNA processing RNA-helicase [Ascosphaera acerosa]
MPKNARGRDTGIDQGPAIATMDMKAMGAADEIHLATPAHPPANLPPRPPVSDEQKKAERLAKLEAWKKKQAAEKERKEQEARSAKDVLAAIDEKAAAKAAAAAAAAAAVAASVPPRAAPATAPASTGTETGSGSDGTVTVTTSTTIASDAPGSTYAGKFDPKAIVKKAAPVTQPSASAPLGVDVPVPQVPKGQTCATTTTTATTTTLITPAATSAAAARSAPLKAGGNVSGFGLGVKTVGDTAALTAKRTLDFGEEEATTRKLAKLPEPALEEAAGATVDEHDQDDDTNMRDGSEEAMAEAAKAAADRRGELLQQEAAAQQATLAGDADMKDAPESAAPVPQPDQDSGAAAADDADVDPLDAFMSTLVASETQTQRRALSKHKSKAAPEALFGDEAEPTLTAVEGEDDILAMASRVRKKKDIPTVDHSKVDYEPFRKAFYMEPTDLAEMTEADVANVRHELDGIKVRGVDVPKPVTKWSQCGLGVQTLDVIEKLGYEGPTSIQAQALPAIMSGRDVIGVAKTGSGKTIAFLLPMFRHIKDQRPLENLEGPIGLIMTPTRELATQIHKDCKAFLKALNLRAVCAYGGAPIKDQIAELKRGAEIIVCTPGRMIDLLAANSGRVTNLRRVTYVVLDEADRMFDMGFEPQVMRILANVRPNRQTVLFSATFPRQMEALARKTLSKPVEIIVGGRSVVAPEITQIVEVREEATKFVRLLELLGNLYDTDEDARTLIFVDRQEAADGLLRDLMQKGYPCMSIHGGKDQVDRDSTIEDFKAGVVPVLIATSVAARGLDVKQLKLVVNYDAPNHLEDYVHRAGRTGRAGNKGTAVTFLTPTQERYSVDISKALRQSGQDVPEPVQGLVDAFMEKVKAGKEKASGFGFGGKGLERLDQERDAARTRERKTYKTGEDEQDEDKDEGKDGAGAAAKEDRFAKAASAVHAASSTSHHGAPAIPEIGPITVHKTERPAPASLKAAAAAALVSNDPLAKVGSAVADINARLGKSTATHKTTGGVPDNKGPDAGAYHATLEINDFPQKARWAVTNRTNVAKILEATGTSITTKGSFYPPGKAPGPGENPKLYILVEGDTELVVTDAMRELTRLLREGTIAAADSEARQPGRYSVL